MDIDDFEDKVDRWGEDVASWPEPSRTRAFELLRSSPAARDLLAEAGALRSALAQQPAVRAPDDLKTRIFAAAREAELPPPRPPATPVASSRLAHLLLPPLDRALRPILLLSTCFLLGLASSLLTAEPRGDQSRFGVAGSLLEELR